eukprot:TRINITY_DN7222_c0_g2_i1.p1 TRINITY_DN7222_c0_g2~~TRINITY_DN7222_c0_g2_i1.p1  ORF type:complete len:239 (+),score=27.34 TRINITY_DN7222_c0_g2_i1:74-790(+)
MPAFDYYLVIDFEASGHVRDSKEWEIVEFPIVVVDAQRLQVQTCEFHRYVKPTRNPQLSEFCITNCGISQHDVDQASTIDVVVREAIDWVSSLNLGGRFAVATCGDYDLKTALQAEAHRKQFSLPDWLQCWVNIKVPFARLFGGATGMKGMLSRLKLNLDGRHHRGIDDARNIAKIVIALLNLGDALELTGSCQSSGSALQSPTTKQDYLHLTTLRQGGHEKIRRCRQCVSTNRGCRG